MLLDVPKAKPATTPRYSFERRAGQPFDTPQVEEYCLARAGGSNIAVSSRHAGVATSTGSDWEQREEVRARQRELRSGQQTFTTVSVAWICEELKRNAEEARRPPGYNILNKQGEPVEIGSPPNYKASNEALGLLLEIVTTHSDKLTGLGTGVPTGNSSDLRAHVRQFLSANSSSAPIVVPGVDVTEDAEALQ